MKQYLTDKQFRQLCNDMIILTDTREQENSHIVQWFDKAKVRHEQRALDYGDYCFKICDKADNNFKSNWFVDELFIERKNSLEELATSLCEQRFHRELKLASRVEYKVLLIENASGYEDILLHKYRNKYDPKAFYNTLRALEIRYGLHIEFIPRQDGKLSGQAIYSICKTVLKSKIITK